MAHAAVCGYCTPDYLDGPFPCGRGWHGPFDDVRKAELVALALWKFMRSQIPRARVRWCERCVKHAPEARLIGDHAFDIAVVDWADVEATEKIAPLDGDWPP